MKMIELTIPGVPIPWKSHAGYGRKSFNPLYREREYVQYEARKQYQGELLQGPLYAEFVFYMPIPKSFSKKKRQQALHGEIHHTNRPDRTNLIKFEEDCLIGIVYADDSAIICGPVAKLYGDPPRTYIKICTLNEVRENEDNVLREWINGSASQIAE